MNEQIEAKAAGDSLSQRKERLEALKARRGRQVAANRDLGAAISNTATAGPSATQKSAQQRRIRKGGAAQRKILIKVHNVLTRTPLDERGYVDGTQFTVAGVERLMSLLGDKADGEGKPGAKAANAALRFLTDEDTDGQTIVGADLNKLQKLSRRFDKLKRRKREGR